MDILVTFLMVLAAVLLLLAAFRVTLPRVDFGWLGLFFAVVSLLIRTR